MYIEVDKVTERVSVFWALLRGVMVLLLMN